MRRSPWTSWLVATSLTFFGTTAQEIPGNVAIPGTVEVELLFPRNESYAPLRYMPVVFSISNPELAEVLLLDVEFRIYDTIDYTHNTLIYKEIDIPSANLSSVASKIAPHLAPTFLTRTFDVEGAWEIKWMISWKSCAKGQNATTNNSTHSTFFSTKKSAQAVDLVAATKNEGTCSATNTTIGFDVVARHETFSSYQMCAEVASPLLTPTPCQIEIDTPAASSISASMTSSLCRTVTPGSPPPRGIAECPTPKSNGAQKPLVGGVACLLALLACLLDGLW